MPPCGHGGADGRGQRDRLPGGVLDAVPRDVVADRVAALAVRERAGGCDRRRRRSPCERQDGNQGDRAGRRRWDGRHRFRVPFGDVRAQRRRPVHLLRQRGLHEHRRSTVGCDPAGSAHGDDRGGRAPPGELVRTGQEHARPGHGAPYSICGHRNGGRPARPRGEGDPGHVDPGRPLHPHPRAMPPRMGERLERHRTDRAAWRRRPASFPSSRPRTAR